MTDEFRTVLDMSLTGSLVILVVLGCRFALQRQPKIYAYALWSVVLFRLLCPVSLSAPLSLVQLSQPQVLARGEVTSSVTYFPDAQLPREDVAPSQSVQSLPAAPEGLNLEKTLSWLWCAGGLGMLALGVGSLGKLRRQLIGAVEVRRGIYQADHIPSAFVLGLLNPRIYLPSGVPLQDQVYILAHEQCHIRRGDHWIKVLAYGALCLHWFNPLVWIAFFLAGKDMEMSCDEAVIGRLGEQHRGDYAQVLLRQTAAGKGPLALLSFGEGNTGGRIRNMAAWRRPTRRMAMGVLVLCAAVLVFCALNPSQGKDHFGTWIGEGDYEDLTQPSDVEYLKRANGLSSLTDHRIYHRDGFFQVDLQFAKDAPRWQWENGLNFAVEKFYYRRNAQYTLREYDLWLIDHAQERTRGLTYRCFVNGKLQMLVSYPEEGFPPEQHLKLTVHPGEEGRRFEGEELGGSFPQGMTYERIRAVDLTLEDGTLPLEEALKQGRITSYDLFSQARMDAQAGICQELHESIRGVAGYTFQYEAFSLLWVNDLYETPDGGLDPVHYLVVYPQSSVSGNVSYHHSPNGREMDLETGLYNDREDWGLRFTVREATPTGVTLECSQSGGQQVGTLCVAWCFLSEGSWPVDRIIREDNSPWLEIPMNQESELTIDWSAICGEKESGNYQLDIYVEDEYEEAQKHPLIDKYYDVQPYCVEFTIP